MVVDTGKWNVHERSLQLTPTFLLAHIFQSLRVFELLVLSTDLDGTSFAHDCRMRFLERALLASCKNCTQLSSLNMAYTYDCRRVLKHDFLKSYDILFDVHDNSCRRLVVSLSHATKSYRVNHPLEINPLICLLLRLRHLRGSTTVKRLRMRQIRTSGRIGFPEVFRISWISTLTKTQSAYQCSNTSM